MHDDMCQMREVGNMKRKSERAGLSRKAFKQSTAFPSSKTQGSQERPKNNSKHGLLKDPDNEIRQDIAQVPPEDISFRVPAFTRQTHLNNCWFKVGNEEYEIRKGQFFKKKKTIGEGSSFGEIALQRKCLRTATVKTEADCQFACMSKEGFEASVLKIIEDIEN